jgi:hypothetical protein
MCGYDVMRALLAKNPKLNFEMAQNECAQVCNPDKSSGLVLERRSRS